MKKILFLALNSFLILPFLSAQTGGDSWFTDISIRYEQEVNFNKDFTYKPNSAEGTPSFGIIISNPQKGLSFDSEYLMGFSDEEGFWHNRFTIGIKYGQSYDFNDKNKIGWAFRIAYRNDIKNYSPIKFSLDKTTGISLYYNKIRDQRDEIFLEPSLNYEHNKKWRLFLNLTFRGMSNPYKYIVYEKGEEPYFIKKNGISFIQEHDLGFKYTFNNKSTTTFSYNFKKENLTRSAKNLENFLYFDYIAILPNGDKIGPYFRLPLYFMLNQGYGWQNEKKDLKEKLRPRIGLKYSHPFTKVTDLSLDFYYRPESTWTMIEEKREKFIFNNFFYLSLKLTHKFRN